MKALPLLFSFLAPAAIEPSGALVRIERAYADGQIDSPTRAIYGLLLLRAPDRLPDAFRPTSAERIRCGTLLMRRAYQEREAYDAEQQALFTAYGGRPALQQDNTIIANLPDSLHEITVHYPDSVSVTLAQSVANYAEESWDIQCDQFGWREPLLDDGTGGSTDLDIYLDPSLAGSGAYTAPAGASPAGAPDQDYPTFIAIDPGVPNIETYVAHELNHSVQFAYDASEADWLFEATATWMEDKVFDSVDDYLFFTTDFQNAPTNTLSFATYDNTYMYGGAVFLHYLAERFDADGTTLVRGLWTDSTSTDFFDALEDTILPSLGSSAPADLMSLYAEFAGYRWLAGSNSDATWSDEAAGWDEVPYARRFASLADATSNGNDVTSNPMKLGTSYIEVMTADGVNGDRLTFTLHGATDTAWAVTVVGQKASGAGTVTVFRDDDNDGEIVATSDSNNQFEKVVFAVANLGVAGQNPDRMDGGGGHTADLTRSAFTFDVFYSAEGGDPVPEEPIACECSATRATPSKGTAFMALLAIALVLGVRSRF